MKPLIETNPYLRDPEQRRRLLERNALDSSAFEGARGLTPHKAEGSSPSKIASKKKSVKGS